MAFVVCRSEAQPTWMILLNAETHNDLLSGVRRLSVEDNGDDILGPVIALICNKTSLTSTL